MIINIDQVYHYYYYEVQETTYIHQIAQVYLPKSRFGN